MVNMCFLKIHHSSYNNNLEWTSLMILTDLPTYTFGPFKFDPVYTYRIISVAFNVANLDHAC